LLFLVDVMCFKSSALLCCCACCRLQEVMAQFKRVLERFMPQDEQQEADAAAAADGEAGAEAPAAADAAGPAHSDADSDEEGEWRSGLIFCGVCLAWLCWRMLFVFGGGRQDF
jgi:hypothetical protein